MPSRKTPSADLLLTLGERIRAARRSRGETLATLARTSGLSRRFLSDVEHGRANVSIKGLARIAEAVGLRAADLLEHGADPDRERARRLLDAVPEEALAETLSFLWSRVRRQAVPRLALVGLRGAGKSTIGRRCAAAVGLPFVELDERIEEAAGLTLSDLFVIHGEDHYRRLERDCLEEVVCRGEPLVLASGGGIVTAPDTWRILQEHFVTCWLRAEPRDHWNRVVDQGDRRPMQEHPAAMSRLEEILQEREPLYARARHHVDTSALGLEAGVEMIVRLLRALLGQSTGDGTR